jgi:Ser/Thr protein kinase RdoA (MazF antagonist)
VVAKFYRPGRWSDAQIVEEHGFALDLAAAEVPVVPPLALHADPAVPGLVLHGEPPTLACHDVDGATHRFAVAARCAGREPELDDPATLAQIGRFIGRLHAVGRQRPFVHRHRLDAHADGQRALSLLLRGDFVPPTELPAWRDACERALALAAAAFDAAAPLATLRLHGDCHRGNVLWRDGAPHVVDLDDAMQGPAVQDLWMLVSGDAATMAQQLNTLLGGYEQFCDFDDRERALIEPLRTLRMVRHSAWLAERWGDPTFPINFPFFGSAAYWNQQTTQLREQIEAMGA